MPLNCQRKRMIHHLDCLCDSVFRLSLDFASFSRQPDSLMMIGIDHDADFSEYILKATPRFKIDSMPALIARISASRWLSNPPSLTRSWYRVTPQAPLHQTFSTKELVDEMKDILRMVAKDNEIVIEKMEVMPDHVHVLISFPNQQDANQRYLSTKVHSSFSNDIQKLDNHNIGVVIYGFPTTICVRSAI